MLRSGHIPSTEVTRSMLDRIESLDQKPNAFATVAAGLALAQARTADPELAEGHARGPLHGILIAVKGVFETKGVRTNPQAFSESIQSSMQYYQRRTAADCAQAQHFPRKFKKQVDTLTQRCDVLLTPTSTAAAAPIAAQPADRGRERWQNTGIVNFTGQPSVSVPCGFTRAGLPGGMMITGRMFDDARAFEEAMNWYERHPAVG